jgi:hypothetical protein
MSKLHPRSLFGNKAAETDQFFDPKGNCLQRPGRISARPIHHGRRAGAGGKKMPQPRLAEGEIVEVSGGLEGAALRPRQRGRMLTI